MRSRVAREILTALIAMMIVSRACPYHGQSAISWACPCARGLELLKGVGMVEFGTYCICLSPDML